MGRDNVTTAEKNRFAIVCSFLIALLAVAVFSKFLFDIKREKKRDDYITITSHCNVTRNDEVYNDVDLMTFAFDTPMVKGDHITLSFEIPDGFVPNPIIVFYQNHSIVRVRLGDRLIYSLGDENSLMLGYGKVYANLPPDYKGKTVTMEFDITQNESKINFIPPEIHDGMSYEYNFVLDNSLYLILDLGIIVLSLMIIIITMIFSTSMPQLSNIVYLGFSFYIMGIWEMCSYNLINIFSESPVLKGYIEYLSFYIGPFFLAVYFYNDFFSDESKHTRFIYKIITICHAVFPVAAIILHFTDTLRLPSLIPYSHAILVANLLTVFFVLIRKIIRKKNNHFFMMVGLIVIIVLAATDLVRLNIYKYIVQDSKKTYTSTLLLGFFVFIIMMILDFFVNQKRSIYRTAKAEAMSVLAHIDIMTGIANRRKCEEALIEIVSADADYALVSVDINFLKVTNDNFGHQEGDRLLTDFAKLLSSSAGDESWTVGRMGGDEFMVIMPGAKKDTAEEFLKTLFRNRDEINASRKPLPISFACGYAVSDEDIFTAYAGNDRIEEVYRVADERMYENKAALKAEMANDPKYAFGFAERK
ncbi:MAG: GGDEF domain-containing protein [Lachnospiraceae bacterium]|nr:GGDEF domain-containing protein [Lachnospiraceae bacterium]